MTGFSLANPKLHGERDQARQTLERQPANRPAPGTAVVTDKGLSGQETEEYFACLDLGLADLPARKDEKQPRPFPNWLRQRVEAVIWTLKNQLGLERHGGRVPACLWTRIVQRLLALNACIWTTGSQRRPRQAVPDRLRPHLTRPHSPVNDLGADRVHLAPGMAPSTVR